MTDEYRTSAFLCPVCERAPLREFHGRYVCDECRGMLLTVDDFAGSIREIDGSTEAVELVERPGQTRACPRCGQGMSPCSLTIGSLEIAGEHLLRCARDGLWLPRDLMTAAYARASRRGGFRGGGVTAAGSTRRIDNLITGPSVATSMITNMPAAHGGMSGAMASIAGAFAGGGAASDGLAIHHWPHLRPRAHTLFVSAHKDLALACPACSTPLAYHGDRWTCSTCHGLFVENEALVAMATEMAQAPWQLPASAGRPGDHACPVCKAPMTVEPLEAVAIDRCDIHGVWFEDHKLEQALLHASAPPHGLLAWLKRLFGGTRS